MLAMITFRIAKQNIKLVTLKQFKKNYSLTYSPCFQEQRQ